MAAIVEQLPSGVLVIDPTGRPVLVNAACRRILGQALDPALTVDEQAGTFAPREAATGAPVPVASLRARVLAGEELHAYELTLQSPATSLEMWLQLSASPLRDSSGAITGAVVVMNDLTQERTLARDVAATARENIFLHGALAERERRLQDLVERLIEPSRRAIPEPGRVHIERLTRREREVLRLLGAGQTNPDIADKLGLSVSTVRLHVKHILAKLGVATRMQAALYAWQLWHPSS
jgi:DNA-binding CsgD family transcriptional regulator